MPWINDGNRLLFEGDWPFNEHDILQKINELEQLDNGFNRPQSICRRLRETVATHFIKRETIYIFSKWCNWSYVKSMNKAKEISQMLFDGTICPRLYYKGQRETEKLPNAGELYEKWVNELVAHV
jgi:hypothetical protein